LGIVEVKPVPTKKASKNKSKPFADGYSKEEQLTLKTAHQRNLYGIAAGLDDTRSKAAIAEQDKALIQANAEEDAQQQKIDKLKEHGLSEMEAQGVAAWIDGNFVPMNREIHSPTNAEIDKITGDFFKESRAVGESAGAYAAQGLRKLPSYDNAEMSRIASEKGQSMIEGGYLKRYLDLFDHKIDSFLAPYEDAVGKSEFKEPTFLATTAIEGLEIEEISNIEYVIKPKSDGTGQGRVVDAFKNEAFEGEVLYPPYSRFKVLEVERIEPEVELTPSFKSLQKDLPSKYSEMGEEELISHFSELVKARFNLYAFFDKHIKQDVVIKQKKYIEDLGIHVENEEHARKMADAIIGLFYMVEDGKVRIHMEEI
jgi:hypothetical protein